MRCNIANESESAGAISFTFSWGSTVTNCTIGSIRGTAIEIGNNSSGMWIAGNYIDGVRPHSGIGVVIAGSHSVHLAGNTTNVLKAGIDLWGAFGVSIDGCYFEENDVAIRNTRGPAHGLHVSGSLFGLSPGSEADIVLANIVGAVIQGNTFQATRADAPIRITGGGVVDSTFGPNHQYYAGRQVSVCNDPTPECDILDCCSTGVSDASVTIYTPDGVGIGTASPTERLDVVGNVKASGTIQAGLITIDGTTAGFERIVSTYSLEIFSMFGGGGLRIWPAQDGFALSGNLVGGSHINSVGVSVVGATIAGGGSWDYQNSANDLPNRATASYATVGGGANNTASGLFATVPGGDSNSAADYSFAAGRRAKADFGGSFVWADSTDADFASSATNQFNVRAAGGTRIFSNTGATVGVQLAAGGNAWSPISDRNVKENVVPVDGREVLDRLVALPVATWNLISQDPNIRHMGPMAQDFHVAFGIGEVETHISTTDADGVALAAIKGLHEIVEEKEAEIANQREQIADLTARLERLETLIAATAKEESR